MKKFRRAVQYNSRNGNREYFRHNIIVSVIASALISVSVSTPHIIGILSLNKTAGAEFAIALCMPFSVNREIIEGAWGYAVIIIGFCTAAVIYIHSKKLQKGLQ